ASAMTQFRPVSCRYSAAPASRVFTPKQTIEQSGVGQQAEAMVSMARGSMAQVSVSRALETGPLALWVRVPQESAYFVTDRQAPVCVATQRPLALRRPVFAASPPSAVGLVCAATAQPVFTAHRQRELA